MKSRLSCIYCKQYLEAEICTTMHILLANKSPDFKNHHHHHHHQTRKADVSTGPTSQEWTQHFPHKEHITGLSLLLPIRVSNMAPVV